MDESAPRAVIPSIARNPMSGALKKGIPHYVRNDISNTENAFSIFLTEFLRGMPLKRRFGGGAFKKMPYRISKYF
jgi:hypothetical protein